MTVVILRFLSIVLTGIIAGIVLGIWLGYNPATFKYTTFVESQQGAIRGLNILMPLLGLLAILCTVASALLHRSNKTTFSVLIMAAILLISSGLITRFGNQPINAIVMTWTVNDSPSDWTQLRERWWLFHQIRTLAMLAAFCLIAWTVVRK